MTCQRAVSICFRIKHFQNKYEWSLCCHVVSPEKQESWGVNKQLLSTLQPRKAEHASAAPNRPARPCPWRTEGRRGDRPRQAGTEARSPRNKYK